MKIFLLKYFFLWGFVLWLFGYILGIVFFAFVPASIIGWVIMPFGITFTLWVLFKKIKLKKISDYFWLGVGWSVLAIILDYFFLVKLLHPAEGYYKLDVYLYYLLTFLIPVLFAKIRRP